ncbi:BgTH12-06514 [Blumeria graminis f. sp. triticale]|uniref:L-dopachrome isomerase n=3 Tax=Blumeria graminis TaxID=34373 RepID=A0A061HN33_BLUGR|nr:hypothetical protein BGT96224_4236 [Blumeria graminis f. sp. tritici 96224]CAD6500808.1 BgTH12-06514 [Blumeria graminis f. sp. triticale]VCU41087.1 Bgt-4236 [Blumeria graminis f. sp. tritici]
MPASTLSSVESIKREGPLSSPARTCSRRAKFPAPLSGLPPSPVDSQSEFCEEHSATAKEEKRLTRKITRSTPGDPKSSLEMKNSYQRDVARKRSLYFEDAFAVNRKPLYSPRERILLESLIMADIKTNVIIHDEHTFITDLSYALSTRYQRPQNSILVTMSHSCCVLFGGNFEPAYIMNITALPSQVLPVTNKRNAVLLGRLMEESLGVSAERGVIKFTAIAEENLANHGRTVAADIEDLERAQHESQQSVRCLSSRGTIRSRRRPSMKSMRNHKDGYLPTHDEVAPNVSSPPISNDRHCTSLADLSTGMIYMDHRSDRVQKMGRRKSFMASIFGRAG